MSIMGNVMRQTSTTFDMEIVQNIFENMNIYQSIILFSNKHAEHAFRIADKLSQEDFPVKVYTTSELIEGNIDRIEKDKTDYRMFFVPFDKLIYFIELWGEDIANMNFIMFIGKDVKSKFDQIALALASRFKLNTSNIIRYVVTITD
jgi:hypothetical protein